jgi:hypothetical protein
MSASLLNQLTSVAIEQLTEDWRGIVVAGVLAAVAALGRWILRGVQAWWKTRHDFGLSGYWIGECDLPSYPQPKLEIWRYVQRGDDVSFRFCDYDQKDPAIFDWIGRGVLRGDLCSLYYYKHHSQDYDSGVLLLRLKGRRLEGIYAQYDPNAPSASVPLFVSNIRQGAATKLYTQFRAQLPFLAKARMALGWPPFKKHAEVAALFEKTTK